MSDQVENIRVERQIRIKLQPADLAILMVQHTDIYRERNVLKNNLAALKEKHREEEGELQKQISAKNSDMDVISEQVCDGHKKEVRTVTEFIDYERQIVFYRDPDTNDVLDSRPMTKEDHQASLHLVDSFAPAEEESSPDQPVDE